jgi:sterol desaturase/sphingolipid hydroxylase (fatty acid hydroxylase superfamily)
MAVLEDPRSYRLIAFLAVFLLMALAERLWPRRARTEPTSMRWGANLGLATLGMVVSQAVAQWTPVAMAELATVRGWGLLPALGLSGWALAMVGILLLDVAIWFQHLVFHRVPVLWRLHAVHHSDHDLDVASGLRFHPIEILLSLVYKVALVVALGIPAGAVLAFEILLNAGALITHANLRLPLGLDRTLRFLLVTPDMHRIHHSTLRDEQDSNYGFHLAIWDRLFRTYRAMPRAAQDHLPLGLNDQDVGVRRGLGALLALPFRRH